MLCCIVDLFRKSSSRILFFSPWKKAHKIERPWTRSCKKCNALARRFQPSIGTCYCCLRIIFFWTRSKQRETRSLKEKNAFEKNAKASCQRVFIRSFHLFFHGKEETRNRELLLQSTTYHIREHRPCFGFMKFSIDQW
jgi:hypothetical protein